MFERLKKMFNGTTTVHIRPFFGEEYTIEVSREDMKKFKENPEHFNEMIENNKRS